MSDADPHLIRAKSQAGREGRSEGEGEFRPVGNQAADGPVDEPAHIGGLVDRPRQNGRAKHMGFLNGDLVRVSKPGAQTVQPFGRHSSRNG